jgi:serine/threonine-protein kinase
MALKSGTHVGPYEIIAALGAGGMGEVYRATDTKLKRDVAIKVLPADVAGDPDRLARFEREALVLASLNHPHIASIYGLEDSDGEPCLVLELVDGPTLAETTASRPVALDEALEMARQIASALEAAHEKGVIHRDLKPANVKITPEGNVKVLDFGLAKAFADESMEISGDPSRSPTMTMSATRAGVILGTAAYMSPEQARGKPVDKRTDIWAFGAVLYEMLTGRQAFPGQTASDAMAKILEREPDWEALPVRTPLKVRELLRRCLCKEQRDRLHDIADARIEIDEVLADPTAAEHATDGAPLRALWIRALPWVLAAVTTFAFLALLKTNLETDRGAPQQSTHLSVVLPPHLRLYAERPTVLAMSPDGRRLATVVDDGGIRRLFVQSLDEAEGSVLAGTEGANSPFFSPDGRWLGFKADVEEKLKKIPVDGGVPVVIVDDVWGRGAIWGPDDFVIFPKEYSGGLWRVAAAGGRAEPVTETDASETAHWWPQVFLGGRALLFTSFHSTDPDENRIVVRSLETGQDKVLVENATFGRYVATGHLLYMQRGIFFAVRFDASKLETIGSPVPVLDDVGRRDVYRAGHIEITADGTLAYISQSILYPPSHLVWVNRDGSEQRSDASPASYANPRFSPDGHRVALSLSEESRDLWVYELSTGRLDRLTHEPIAEEAPIWTADGRDLIYSAENINLDLYRKPSDGSGDATLLHSSAYDLIPESVSPDGKWLIFSETPPDTETDLWLLSLEGESEPTTFLRTRFNENTAAFSPDGRWVAYTSHDSGRREIYVREFPGAGKKTRVSVEGGDQASWSPDGKELYFLNGHKMMAAVVVRRQEELAFGTPRTLFEAPYETHWLGKHYDVSPDGRFLMVKVPPDLAPRRVNVVLNWFEELERLVPAD